MFADAMCLAQDRQHLNAWQNSPGQICQDVAWEKLHTGDWKSVPLVSVQHHLSILCQSLLPCMPGGAQGNISCQVLVGVEGSV